MYLSYYGLKKEPFHTTPDPSFLFLSPQHKEALGAIIYGIEKRKGFIAIIGEVGVGKTTILRAYLERKASKRQKIVYIFNPVLSYHGLLTAIFRSLEIVPRNDDVTEMVNQLHEALILEYQAGGTVVLAIDEAQNMPMETLENLRMISNLESSTDKLIQIILLGQPELSTMLEQPALRQFRQRIALRATITELSDEESLAFIEHRTKLASNFETPVLFTKGALHLIIRQAQGIPRRLNILCDNALITGFGRQCKPVPASVVKEVIRDIDGNKITSASPYLKWAVGLGVAITLIIGFLYLFDSLQNSDKTAIPPMADQIKSQTPIMNARSKAASSSLTQPKHIVTPSGKVDFQEVGIDKERSVHQQNQPTKVSDIQASKEIQNESTIINNPKEQIASSPKSEASRKKLNSPGDSLIENEERINSIQNAIYAKAKTPSSSRVTRTIQEGENLSLIAAEVYGSQNGKYIEWLKKHNPHIVNPNVVLPGQQIVLPQYQN